MIATGTVPCPECERAVAIEIVPLGMEMQVGQLPQMCFQIRLEHVDPCWKWQAASADLAEELMEAIVFGGEHG